jgi:hypothetical protein
MLQKILGRERGSNLIRASAAATTVHLLSNGEKFELYLREKIADLESFAAGMDARDSRSRRDQQTGESGENSARQPEPTRWGDSSARAEAAPPESAPTGAAPGSGSLEIEAEPAPTSVEKLEAEPVPVRGESEFGSPEVDAEPAPTRPSFRFTDRASRPNDPSTQVIDPEAGAGGTGALRFENPPPAVSETVMGPEAGLVATASGSVEIARQSPGGEVNREPEISPESSEQILETSPEEIEEEPAGWGSWDDLLGGVGPKGEHA